MGFVLNTQRRALEVFAHGFAKAPWPPEALSGENIRFILGKKGSCGGGSLIFLGISCGVGTCSDLHGVDIAVFELAPLNWDGKHKRQLDLPRLAGCAYAVFLWPGNVVLAQPLEIFSGPLFCVERFIRVNVRETDPTRNLVTAELLEFSSFERWNDSFRKEEHTTIYLTRTGLLSSYVPI